MQPSPHSAPGLQSEDPTVFISTVPEDAQEDTPLELAREEQRLTEEGKLEPTEVPQQVPLPQQLPISLDKQSAGGLWPDASSKLFVCHQRIDSALTVPPRSYTLSRTGPQ